MSTTNGIQAAYQNVSKQFASIKGFKFTPRPSPYMANRQTVNTKLVCTVWELKILRRALKNAMGKRKGGGCPEFETMRARIDAQIKNLVG